jgi:hypothetical protein
MSRDGSENISREKPIFFDRGQLHFLSSLIGATFDHAKWPVNILLGVKIQESIFNPKREDTRKYLQYEPSVFFLRQAFSPRLF